MSNDTLGKKAEAKIKEWLDHPEEGISIDRLYDPMGGFYGVANPCDFICYKYPNIYYIESKATYSDRFDFAMIRPNQIDSLVSRSKIFGCQCWIIVLFASHKRAFRFKATDIKEAWDNGTKSLNIHKLDDWKVPYKELATINSRKSLLDYTGSLEDLL